jgi:hypothetical protein
MLKITKVEVKNSNSIELSDREQNAILGGREISSWNDLFRESYNQYLVDVNRGRMGAKETIKKTLEQKLTYPQY